MASQGSHDTKIILGSKGTGNQLEVDSNGVPSNRNLGFKATFTAGTTFTGLNGFYTGAGSLWRQSGFKDSDNQLNGQFSHAADAGSWVFNESSHTDNIGGPPLVDLLSSSTTAINSLYPWNCKYGFGPLLPDGQPIIFELPETLLTGIQNISFSQEVQEAPIQVLGGLSAPVPQGPTTTKVSIDKVLLNKDYMLTLTGSTGLFGQFIYGDNILDFENAVMDGFTVSATIGEVPQIAFELSVYGDLSGSNHSRLPRALKDSKISSVTQSGISVVFDKKIENAVQSFNFTENYQWQPSYKIGQVGPCNVELVSYASQEANISIEVEDYTFENNYSFSDLTSAKNRDRNISFTLTNKNGDSNEFIMKNASLVAENISAGVGNTVVANLTYRGSKTIRLGNNPQIVYRESIQGNE